MLRPFVPALLLLAAVVGAGCTDRLSLNAATIDEPSFDLAPREGDAKTVFKVDARGLGEKHNVTWDWGDDTLGYGEQADHRYGFTNGVMTVTMLVKDADGRQGFASDTIELGSGKNADPRVTLRAQRTWVEVGKPANLTASASDADRDPLTYLWTYRAAGDAAGESRVIPGDGSRTSATFDAPGRYDVTVRARDPKGGEAVANVTVQVSTSIPSSVFTQTFEGTLVAGTGGASASEQLWVLPEPVPDSGVDAARHRYTLEYPGSTVIVLLWNDTSGQGVVDLDLELRHAGNGTTVFKSQTRAPAAPVEYNFTRQDAGDYEIVVRGVVGADVTYTVTVQSSLAITPELVAAKEASG